MSLKDVADLKVGHSCLQYHGGATGANPLGMRDSWGDCGQLRTKWNPACFILRSVKAPRWSAAFLSRIRTAPLVQASDDSSPFIDVRLLLLVILIHAGQ